MKNRYSPPLSEVEGQPPPRSAPPRGVTLALRFLWISLALGVPTVLYGIERSPGGVAFGITIAIQLALFAFYAYVNVCIYRARNWARIITMLLSLLGLGIIVAGFTSSEDTIVEVVCMWISTAFEIAATCLLFTRAASAWFRGNKTFVP